MIPQTEKYTLYKSQPLSTKVIVAGFSLLILFKISKVAISVIKLVGRNCIETMKRMIRANPLSDLDKAALKDIFSIFALVYYMGKRYKVASNEELLIFAACMHEFS